MSLWCDVKIVTPQGHVLQLPPRWWERNYNAHYFVTEPYITGINRTLPYVESENDWATVEPRYCAIGPASWRWWCAGVWAAPPPLCVGRCWACSRTWTSSSAATRTTCTICCGPSTRSPAAPWSWPVRWRRYPNGWPGPRTCCCCVCSGKWSTTGHIHRSHPTLNVIVRAVWNNCLREWIGKLFENFAEIHRGAKTVPIFHCCLYSNVLNTWCSLFEDTWQYPLHLGGTSGALCAIASILNHLAVDLVPCSLACIGRPMGVMPTSGRHEFFSRASPARFDLG